MNLEEKYITLIRLHVNKYLPQAQIFLFGSRAKNTNKEFSDIDIAIKDQNLNQNIIAKIKFELEESDIPYKIDVADYNDLPQNIVEEFGDNF